MSLQDRLSSQDTLQLLTTGAVGLSPAIPYLWSGLPDHNHIPRKLTTFADTFQSLALVTASAVSGASYNFPLMVSCLLLLRTQTRRTQLTDMGGMVYIYIALWNRFA